MKKNKKYTDIELNPKAWNLKPPTKVATYTVAKIAFFPPSLSRIIKHHNTNLKCLLPLFLASSSRSSSSLPAFNVWCQWCSELVWGPWLLKYTGSGTYMLMLLLFLLVYYYVVWFCVFNPLCWGKLLAHGWKYDGVFDKEKRNNTEENFYIFRWFIIFYILL